MSGKNSYLLSSANRWRMRRKTFRNRYRAVHAHEKFRAEGENQGKFFHIAQRGMSHQFENRLHSRVQSVSFDVDTEFDADWIAWHSGRAKNLAPRECQEHGTPGEPRDNIKITQKL